VVCLTCCKIFCQFFFRKYLYFNKIFISSVDANAEFDTEKADSTDTGSTSDRDKLIHELLKNYKKSTYPEKTTVQFGVSLLNVDMVSQKKNQIKFTQQKK
jgi:hypothetical protein